MPAVGSVEEVLRRQRDAFDLVYLHRLANAEAYGGLARAWQTRARLLYSVADLHHVRLARQAAVQGTLELAAEARLVRGRELAAMRGCDVVLTHSPAEAAYLARAATGAAVHVVPWPAVPQRPRLPMIARRDMAFIGGFRHAPNADALRWLAEAVLPRVWARLPALRCFIVGADWPAPPSWSEDARLQMVGPLDDLASLFNTVRLTVAPLRFGAGLKGKVLASLAAGVPCVMTPVAAEGLELAGPLAELVVEGAEALAARIVRLHEDQRLNAACG